MNIGTFTHGVGVAATLTGSVALGGFTGYGVQKWQSGNRHKEQLEAQDLANEARSTGRPKEADKILKSAPSNRERNMDKFGLLTLGGVGLMGGGALGVMADYMSTTGEITRCARVGGPMALIGAGLIGGAALSSVQNMLGRFDK